MGETEQVAGDTKILKGGKLYQEVGFKRRGLEPPYKLWLGLHDL